MYVKNIRSRTWQQGIIIRILSYSTYLAQMEEGVKFVHANDIRPNKANVVVSKEISYSDTQTSAPNVISSTDTACAVVNATTPISKEEPAQVDNTIPNDIIKTIINREHIDRIPYNEKTWEWQSQ